MNWIYLHKNPQVGDYAIYEDEKYGMGMKYEILSQNGPLFHVRGSFTKLGTADEVYRNLVWHYIVSADGLVKEGYMEVDGEKIIQKIPQKGEEAYIEPNFLELKTSETMQVNQKNLVVSHMVLFHTLSDYGFMTIKSTMVTYVNPTIPFGSLRMDELDSAQMPLLDIINFVSDAIMKSANMPMSSVVKKVRDLILDKVKDSARIEWKLTEYKKK